MESWRDDNKDKESYFIKKRKIAPRIFYTDNNNKEWEALRRKEEILRNLGQRERKRGVWREFAKQQYAMAYVDAWPPIKASNFNDNSETILARKQAKEDSTDIDTPKIKPRLWAIELDNKGRRKYVVAHWERFHWEYMQMKERYCYEVIREGMPVRPYFDCEFAITENKNAQLNGEAMVQRWLSLFIDQLCKHFGFNNNDIHTLELDATTTTKFSRHLILTLPKNVLFKDNIALGAFVRHILSNNQQAFLVEAKHNTTACFVDISVYSRNRLFRLCGSAKRGKVNAFYPIRGLFPAALLPIESLIIPLNSNLIDHNNDETFLLHWENNQIQSKAINLSTHNSSTTQCLSATSIQNQHIIATGPPPSPFAPHLDSFVMAARPGSRIRSWQRLAGRKLRPTREGKLIFHLAGNNRYCENIRRSHKSNNVYMIVDLAENFMVQGCHDAESCHGFRGFPIPLPENIRNYVCEILALELTAAIEKQEEEHH
mmetsp:Transcript_5284/g.7825  ORF Transcript_5284/g.7825 Transcript_5284/m.7825 type:complete len:486 (-) Transcript_5284:220-1677(-)